MASDKIDPKVKEIVLKFLEENVYPGILDKDNLLGILRLCRGQQAFRRG